MSVLPTELWLRVVGWLRKPMIYYVGDACCGGTYSPAPGSSLGVGPLPRPADRDCIALACTCRYFRELLADEVSCGELHVCLRAGQLVRHSGGRFPAYPIHDRLSYRALDTAPLGPRTRRLALSLFVYEGLSFAHADQRSLDATADAAADAILRRAPNLVALEVHVRVDHCGNGFALSDRLARAMAALPALVDLSFSGCHLPPLPGLRFPLVRRLQTDHVVTSFDPFPSLRELRNDQHWLEQDAYRIPADAFRRLEVVHYCTPDNTEAIDWFPEDCEELRASVGHDGSRIRVQELVLRHSVDADYIQTIVRALASPRMRVFVCYGIYRDHDRYDQLLALARRAFPNADIDFVDVRAKHAHKH